MATKSYKQMRADLTTADLLISALTKKTGKKFTLVKSPSSEQRGIEVDGRAIAPSMEPRDLRVYLLGMAKLFCVLNSIDSILDFV